MPSPAAAAVDAVLKATLAPDLKAAGYRKAGRNWVSRTPDAIVAVTAQASQFNDSTEARFTVELGVSYPSLGHPDAQSDRAWARQLHLRWRMVVPPGDDWWCAIQLPADDQAIDAAVAVVGEHWRTACAPFLDAARTPQTLCEHVAATGSAYAAEAVLKFVAEALGDPTLDAGLARRAEDQLAGVEFARDGDGHLFPRAVLNVYERRLRHATHSQVTFGEADRAIVAEAVEVLRRDAHLSAHEDLLDQAARVEAAVLDR